MNSAIIFIKNEYELNLAKSFILGKMLIEYTLRELNRLDLDKIYLCGAFDESIRGVIKYESVRDAINDLKDNEGKCLLLSPFYPLVTKREYSNLLNSEDADGAVSIDADGACAFFMLPNNRLEDFESIDFRFLDVEVEQSVRVNNTLDVIKVSKLIQDRINLKHVLSGVKILDPNNTYISQDVVIDKNTVIYPNTVIEGKCLIGKNNVLTSGTYLKNVIMGNDNRIKSSYITNSMICNRSNIGPYVHIHRDCEIMDDVVIKAHGQIKKSKIDKFSKIKANTVVEYSTVISGTVEDLENSD